MIDKTATHQETMQRGDVDSDNEIVARFRNAKYKFIWLTQGIISYPEIIELAVSQVKEDLLGNDAVNKSDVDDYIGCVWLENAGDKKKFFGLYIKEFRCSEIYSTLYVTFKDYFHFYTAGSFPHMDIANFQSKTTRDALVQTGKSPDEAKQIHDFFLKCKRRITHFETLAKKALNRIRLIPVKLRYAILKRDNFTCQLCGRRPPEVILEVDHKISVIDSGGNDTANLHAVCRDCNRGKGLDSLWDTIYIKMTKSEK